MLFSSDKLFLGEWEHEVAAGIIWMHLPIDEFTNYTFLEIGSIDLSGIYFHESKCVDLNAPVQCLNLFIPQES